MGPAVWEQLSQWQLNSGEIIRSCVYTGWAVRCLCELSHFSEPYFSFLKNENDNTYLNVVFLCARPTSTFFICDVSFNPVLTLTVFSVKNIEEQRSYGIFSSYLINGVTIWILAV